MKKRKKRKNSCFIHYRSACFGLGVSKVHQQRERRSKYTPVASHRRAWTIAISKKKKKERRTNNKIASKRRKIEERYTTAK